MKLRLASGAEVEDPSPRDIAQRIGSEDFVVLTRDDDNTYMQCGKAKSPPDEYQLEHQEGSVQKHYGAVDRPLTLERVQGAMVKYLLGDSTWKSDFRWLRMDVGG